LEQLQLNSENKHFAVLPSWQAITTFSESRTESNPDIFTGFFQQLTENDKDIVLIPVNKYQLHWSLLVYEVKKKVFHHYDTASGLNWNYIKPLCQQVLENSGISEKEQEKHLQTHHDFSQGNGHDCGIGVIALTERFIIKHPQDDNELFKDLNLKSERQK
jgi:Ulp1 family protease